MHRSSRRCRRKLRQCDVRMESRLDGHCGRQSDGAGLTWGKPRTQSGLGRAKTPVSFRCHSRAEAGAQAPAGKCRIARDRHWPEGVACGDGGPGERPSTRRSPTCALEGRLKGPIRGVCGFRSNNNLPHRPNSYPLRNSNIMSIPPSGRSASEATSALRS